MIKAWIVIREEKHLDHKYWVFLNRDDALQVAREIAEYWRRKYEPDEGELYVYEDQLFHVTAEDLYRVEVLPQNIREPGETDALHDNQDKR